jgi:IS30 family transposase
LSNREIAQRLGKAPQTIYNELKRGQVQLKRKCKYSAKVAQTSYEMNRKNAKRPLKLTPEMDKTISEKVRNKISLEVIHQEFKAFISLRTLCSWQASL